jgi:hypothetical protein
MQICKRGIAHTGHWRTDSRTPPISTDECDDDVWKAQTLIVIDVIFKSVIVAGIRRVGIPFTSKTELTMGLPVFRIMSLTCRNYSALVNSMLILQDLLHKSWCQCARFQLN